MTAAKTALARADELTAEVERRWPDAWRQMDGFRAHPPQPWPQWCLLPMAAATAVATEGAAPPLSLSAAQLPIAAIAALDAWRYANSVYIYEPHLAGRLTSHVPDPLGGVAEFVGLPEWCVYIADPLPGSGNSGMWAHLEHDLNTGRPELRLLIDPDATGGLDALRPVPVYLDRGSLTEALADFRATAIATLAGPEHVSSGENARGETPETVDAAVADQVDGLVELVRYLARPEADITHAQRRGLTPVRPRRPMRDRNIWLVGHSL